MKCKLGRNYVKFKVTIALPNASVNVGSLAFVLEILLCKTQEITIAPVGPKKAIILSSQEMMEIKSYSYPLTIQKRSDPNSKARDFRASAASAVGAVDSVVGSRSRWSFGFGSCRGRLSCTVHYNKTKRVSCKFYKVTY